MCSILCRNNETNIYYVNTWKKIKIKYLSFLDMCTLFMDIYKHFVHFLHTFCWDFVFFLFCFHCHYFYRKKIETFYTVSLQFSEYIVQTSFACKNYFFQHFINFFHSYFVQFTKILLIFYLIYYTEFFSLSISEGLCSHFKRWKGLKFL